ncbi:protein-export chaperone SecB [Ferruginibacter sp. HRS2-29]|uniref:protein-export chaperone SecB n=1 Tax=Ferruginibacter sp. HRS2-29 TaxID=2487334 RepID=UPI0020CBECF9|nr:protein-export chaperone SecB [Ferruginibacter sp. HRS2-29]MCP9751391.1 hypothetical protein [Ferruginibacter sp. HRS2-29]
MPENIPEVEHVKTGSYKVENIYLIESSFTREVNFSAANGEITNELNIDSEALESTDAEKFGVTLQLDFIGKQGEMNVCNSKIKMIGIFEKLGEPPLPEEVFKRINAPAIIYPFIREHLHNICLKAGISNVLLPTVNFKI